MHCSPSMACVESANKCTKQMLWRFFGPFGLLWITLLFNVVQYLIPFRIVISPHYFFYLEILKDLIALHIVANLMGYTEPVDIS